MAYLTPKAAVTLCNRVYHCTHHLIAFKFKDADHSGTIFSRDYLHPCVGHQEDLHSAETNDLDQRTVVISFQANDHASEVSTFQKKKRGLCCVDDMYSDMVAFL